MAGRGTDIVLGGNVDFMADLLRDRGLDPVETADEYEAAWDDALRQIKDEAEAEAGRSAGRRALRAGHRAARVAPHRQPAARPLGPPGRPRASPGSTCRWVTSSCGGFNGAMVEALLTRINLPDDVPIEAKMVTRPSRAPRRRSSSRTSRSARTSLKYDEVMNQQRTVIYDERKRILEGETSRAGQK